MESNAVKFCNIQGLTLGIKGLSANAFSTDVLIGGAVNTERSIAKQTSVVKELQLRIVMLQIQRLVSVGIEPECPSQSGMQPAHWSILCGCLLDHCISLI